MEGEPGSKYYDFKIIIIGEGVSVQCTFTYS